MGAVRRHGREASRWSWCGCSGAQTGKTGVRDVRRKEEGVRRGASWT
jgi:hypothetical protein